MAHESFEDEAVAEILNKDFISIKVDREDRPDIDGVYMTVCQMITGSGGWPLTIIMTPDKKPFYAGTYFPKESKYGRVGMLELLPRIKEYWDTRRSDLIKTSNSIIKELSLQNKISNVSKVDQKTLSLAYGALEKSFDKKYGGFGTKPKFPTPHNLMFLLRYWDKAKEDKALNMVLKTLDSMAQGGIFDHLGYGFHRYSTDSKWLVPHFEKMLYDQALLAMVYTEAYQITKTEAYKTIANNIFEYVFRKLTSVEGGFYCAEDADSEGEEGKFYVWSFEEIKKVLSDEEVKIAIDTFNLSPQGNYIDESTGKKTGYNILFQKEGDLKPVNDNKQLIDIRKKLFDYRENRIKPHLDDKILTDWNGLMIVAFSKAAAVFNDTNYKNYAKKAADFIIKSLDKDNRLYHSYRENQWSIKGNVSDYSFMIWGLIELYEATFEVNYLKKALELNDKCTEYFWDYEAGGYFFTPKDGEELLVRQKEIYDGAIPSGNSVALLNLLRLEKFTGNSSFGDMAEKLINSFSEDLNKYPQGYCQMLIGVDFQYGSSIDIVISGISTKEDTNAMIRSLNQTFLPRKTLIFNPVDNESSEIHSISNFIKNNIMVDNKATAYVCSNFTCKEPTTDISELLVNVIGDLD